MIRTKVQEYPQENVQDAERHKRICKKVSSSKKKNQEDRECDEEVEDQLEIEAEQIDKNDESSFERSTVRQERIRMLFNLV